MAVPRRLIRDDRWRSGALAAVIAVAMLVDSELCPHGHGISLLGAAAAVGTVVPLVWRTRAPLLVLVLVVAGVVACLATLMPGDTVVLAPMVAAYSVAVAGGDRRRSLLLGAVVLPVALACVVAFSGRVSDLITNGALMVLAVVAGDGVRSRRAFNAAARRRESERRAAAERDAERRVAEERLRIARDVHDVVAHAMVAINVQAGVAAHVLDRRPEQAAKALTEIKRVSGAALGDLRATLGLLREDGASAPVRPSEGVGQLEDLAAPLRSAGLEVDLRLDGPVDALPTPVSAAAHRIVQEALTNVLRHAHARRVTVSVVVDADHAEVEVLDDGDGRVPVLTGTGVPPGSGNGLRGMSERAAAIGGVVESGPAGSHTGGWRVRAVLPAR